MTEEKKSHLLIAWSAISRLAVNNHHKISLECTTKENTKFSGIFLSLMYKRSNILPVKIFFKSILKSKILQPSSYHYLTEVFHRTFREPNLYLKNDISFSQKCLTKRELVLRYFKKRKIEFLKEQFCQKLTTGLLKELTILGCVSNQGGKGKASRR